MLKKRAQALIPSKGGTLQVVEANKPNELRVQRKENRSNDGKEIIRKMDCYSNLNDLTTREKTPYIGKKTSYT